MLRRFLLCLTLLCGLLPSVQAQGNSTTQPSLSILVDVRRIRLDKSAVQTLTQLPPGARIVVPLLSDGEIPFASASSVFPLMPLYNGGEADIALLISEAHKKRIAVYGALTLLRWGAPGSRSGGVLTAHPAWAERTVDNTTGASETGRFASPFHPDVAKNLSSLVDEVMTRFPDLDGLMLDCRLPRTNFYGFSEAARTMAIRKLQIDPLDNTLVFDDVTQASATALSQWRVAMSTTLVKTICDQAQKRMPLKVAVVGEPDVYQQTVRIQGRVMNDWKEWLKLPGVDEVIFPREAATDTATFASLYTAAVGQMQENRKVTVTTWLLPHRGNPRPLYEAVPPGSGALVEITRLEEVSVATRAVISREPERTKTP